MSRPQVIDDEEHERVYRPGGEDDGDVLTSAEVATGVDLCMHIVRRDHGSAVANRAARYCVVPPWRDGGQARRLPRSGANDGGPVAGQAGAVNARVRRCRTRFMSVRAAAASSAWAM